MPIYLYMCMAMTQVYPSKYHMHKVKYIRLPKHAYLPILRKEW